MQFKENSTAVPQHTLLIPNTLYICFLCRGIIMRDAAAEIGRNPISKHQIQPEYIVRDEQVDAGRDCQTCVSRDQILRRERGQGNIHFPCSA